MLSVTSLNTFLLNNILIVIYLYCFNFFPNIVMPPYLLTSLMYRNWSISNLIFANFFIYYWDLFMLPFSMWLEWVFVLNRLLFCRNRSNMACASWWSSSLDSWSCGNFDFHKQHNCSWHICIPWWQGIQAN